MYRRKSEVLKAYVAICEGMWETIHVTYEKSSQAWIDFWRLLITSGFTFQKDEMAVIIEKSKEPAGKQYAPDWHPPTERHYSLAVVCGNTSFAAAYETHHNRNPFIGSGICYPEYCLHYSNHATIAKTHGRLITGAKFLWQGERVTVTSFDDEKGYLIACAYHPNKHDEGSWYSAKIKRRFKITPAEFRAGQKAVEVTK